jgi:hypothetical protein
MTKQIDAHIKFFNLALTPNRDKIFFNYPNCPDPLCSPPSLIIQQVQGVLSVVVNLLGHEFDHPPPSSAKEKNDWSYTSNPPIHFFMACMGMTLSLPLIG